MKKLSALLVSVLLVLGLAACSGQPETPDDSSAGASSTTDAAADDVSASATDGSATGVASAADSSTVKTPETTAADKGTTAASRTTRPNTTKAPAEETKPSAPTTAAKPAAKKVLVVYYSASGNTGRIAKSIADTANADTFEIVPQKVYTSEDLNWTNSDSRVCREHDDESLRDVPLKTTAVDNWTDYDTVFIGYPIWWGIAAWPVDNFVKANDFTGKTVIPFCTSASSSLGQSGTLLADMAKGGDWQEGQRFSSGASDSAVQTWVNGLGLSK